MVCSVASEQTTNPYPAGEIMPVDTNTFWRKVITRQAPLYVHDASADRAWDTNPEVRDDGFCSYYGLPIRWPDGSPFGTVCVMDFETTHARSLPDEIRTNSWARICVTFLDACSRKASRVMKPTSKG